MNKFTMKSPLLLLFIIFIVLITGCKTDSEYIYSEKEYAAEVVFIKTENYVDNTYIVKLSAPMDGNEQIYYTLDGTRPDRDSALYTDALIISKDTTIKAFNTCDGYEDSPVSSTTIVMRELKKETGQTYYCEYPYVDPIIFTLLPDNDSYYNSDESQKVSVSMDCHTLGTTIHYTMDGSIPTVESPVYTEPLIIDKSVNILAYGVSDHLDDGPVSTASIVLNTTTIINKTETKEEKKRVPSVSMLVYKKDIEDTYETVTMYCWSCDKIYYTLDGSMPTTESSVYTEPFQLTSIDEDIIIQAFATNTDYLVSPVTTLLYKTIKSTLHNVNHVTVEKEHVKPVSFEIEEADSGYYVTMNCETEGAQIYYNLFSNEALYEEKVLVPSCARLSAYAKKDGLENSLSTSIYFDQKTIINKETKDQISYKSYTEPPTIIFEEKSGTSNIYEIIIQASYLSQIYFTTDGSTPEISGEGESSSAIIEVEDDGSDTDLIIKAIAKSSYSGEPSPVVTAIVSLRRKEIVEYVDMKYLNPVNISCERNANSLHKYDITMTVSGYSDAKIYYTTDGTNPDETSTLYTKKLSFTEQKTIKAVAYKDGYRASPVTVYVEDSRPQYFYYCPIHNKKFSSYEDAVKCCEQEVSYIYYYSDEVPENGTYTLKHYRQKNKENFSLYSYTLFEEETKELPKGTRLFDVSKTYEGYKYASMFMMGNVVYVIYNLVETE